MRPYVDTTGLRFGRLTVIVDQSVTRAIVECDCGTVKTVDRRAMRAGRIRSCGCLRDEAVSRTMTTHGQSQSRVYSIWKGMHRRCKDPKSKGWPWYGGKGIKVCEAWSTFAGFWNDMREGYTEDMSIDRIDTTKDYCPENCRWRQIDDNRQRRPDA